MAGEEHPAAEPVRLDASRPTQAQRQLRELLRGTAACERSTAQLLRAGGADHAADRAERAAAHIDLMLNEPWAVRRMHAFARHLAAASHHVELLERTLQGAVSLMRTDAGQIELADPRTGATRVVVRTGSVPPPSIGHTVHSTPLIDSAHRLRGVLSTHVPLAHSPGAEDLQILAWYGELAGAAMTAQQSTPTRLYQRAAACHEDTAERQDAAAAVLRACARSPWGQGARTTAAQLELYAREAQLRAMRERRRGQARRRLIAGPEAAL